MQIVILKGTTFRGTKYYADTPMDVSDNYAKEMLTHGVARPDERASLIADRFVEVLRNWLSAEEWEQMRVRNQFDPRYRNGACASQDFCDANMAMEEAFASVMGRLQDGDDEDDCAIWNAAWELARKQHLGDQ